MKLSIIVPAYNVENYIHNTLTSLINQDEKGYEIIVVDDGSTDRTFNIAELILKQSDIPYKLIKKKNEGVSSARNLGLSEASGEYVMFFDGDDYVSEQLIKNLYQSIENEKPDIICWGHNRVIENNKTQFHYFHEYQLDKTCITGVEALEHVFIKKNILIWTGGIAFKKELIFTHNLKYTETCMNGEDQEFNFIALSRAQKVNFIPKVLSYYVQREGSITHGFNIRRFDIVDALKRTADDLTNLFNPQLKEIIDIIKSDYLIESYLINFESCLRYLQKNHNYKQSLKILFDELEKNYPGVANELNEKMRNYEGTNIVLRYRIKIFLFSPRLYNLLINILRFIKRRKKRWFNIKVKERGA